MASPSLAPIGTPPDGATFIRADAAPLPRTAARPLSNHPNQLTHDDPPYPRESSDRAYPEAYALSIGQNHNAGASSQDGAHDLRARHAGPWPREHERIHRDGMRMTHPSDSEATHHPGEAGDFIGAVNWMHGPPEASPHSGTDDADAEAGAPAVSLGGRSLQGCYASCRCTSTFYDCSNRNLSSIPADIFAGLTNLTAISLVCSH